MTTAVVHVRDAYDIYIGRQHPWRPYRLPRSKWANPFTIGKHGTRAEVIEKYRAYLLGRPDLRADLGSLRNLRLGCWCKPEACHGDVLAELADQTGGELTD
jgi:hypothetical protein